MLQLKNIHKKYQTKKGHKHKALHDINLELNNHGLIVILGKSGSGKSTLLNILGGLDNYDQGEIIIDGKSTNDFKRNEWDSYRNTYVGFVFQEFYMIEEFTVGKNIALALELQGYPKDQIQERVHTILKLVDLDGYADHKPSEISGGQKQRVAIARALVKNPLIILADEPTGNLDSETGRLVLETLKKLSLEKLVIMVTHDEEFAQVYGDRIIQLKDGKISDDHLKHQSYIPEQTSLQPFKLLKSSLPTKNAFTLALSSLLTKKLKLVFMLFLFITSLTFLGIASNFSFYDISTSSALTFDKANVKVIHISKLVNKCDIERVEGIEDNCIKVEGSFLEEEIIDLRNSYDDIKFMKSIRVDLNLRDYIEISHNKKRINYYTTKIIKVTHLTPNQETFDLRYGTTIQNDHDILITDYTANSLLYYEAFEDVSKMDQLVGKIIEVNDIELTIKGIIKTDYEHFNYLKSGQYDLLRQLKYQDMLSSSYAQLVMTEDTYKKTVNLTNVKLLIDEDIQINISSIPTDLPFDLIGTDARLPQDHHEILLPLSVVKNHYGYEDLFDKNGEPKVTTIDEEIMGLTIPLEYGSYIDGTFGNETNDYQIVGVFQDIDFDSNVLADLSDYAGHILFTEEEYTTILTQFDYTKQHKISLTTRLSNDIDDNRHLLNHLEQHDYKHITYYSDVLNHLDTITSNAKYTLLIIGSTFALFTTFLIFTFISSSIQAKSKVIGTLRAIGARGIDVAKIFLIEGLIIALISSILATGVGYIVIRFINQSIVEDFNLSLVLLYPNVLSIGIVFLLALVVVLIATCLPLIRLSIMKPINTIKHQ